MAWTAPRTWVTSEVVTASIMNTHVRDNLLETGPAAATSASSGILVTDGMNSVAQRLVAAHEIDTVETTASTSFTNLTTTGPTVTTTTGTGAFCLMSALMFNNTGGEICAMGLAVSGASSISATNSKTLNYESSNANDNLRASYAWVQTSLTAGSNTFTAQYRVTGGTGSFGNRALYVIGIG